MRPLTGVTIIVVVMLACHCALLSTAFGAPADAGPSATEAEAMPATPPVVLSPAETVENDPVGATFMILRSIKAGDWRYVAAMALGLLMFGLNRARGKIKFFDGDRGGAILVATLAIAGGLSASLAAGAAIDVSLFIGAFGVMLTSVGGYTWFRRLLWPKEA